MNKEIPIFYACDDHFVKYTVVSLHSIIKNASADRCYHVYILHHGVSEEMTDALLALRNDRFSITLVDVGKYLSTIEARLPLRDYYTKTTYFRFFIAEMFPEYDKVIYIDSDTVCQGDPARLFDTDIGDAYVGACHEQAMVQTDVYGTYAERVVGISRHFFFNAGMMLINCAAFRTNGVLDRFIALLGEYNFIVTQDEDYLNLICKDRVFWLDGRWNTEITEGLTYPYDAAREAYILHYIMANKPWHYETSLLGEIFWRYASETSVYDLLRQELAAYTDADRERDRLSGEHLRQMAVEETLREDNYLNRLNRHRDAARVAVIKKIEEYEREGKFDVDVEDDPPTRTLMPHEIDYLRRSPIAKLKTFISYLKAKKFLKYITDKELMIIKEYKGLEHLSALDTGAVITCNHFNPFDTFAMHAAFLASGQQKRCKLYRVIREGNYTSFGGFYGYLMRHFYTLPLSSNLKTMSKFIRATDTLLKAGNLVLIYPEQSMWWNYRKPKPLKSGAYRFSAQNRVPVLPCFITMRDSDKTGEDGFPIQEYTVHICPPIYPKTTLSRKENVAYLMEENTRLWREVYESAYGAPPVYTCDTL